MEINPYEILGIQQSANSEEIKAAYRTLVKQHHPDAGGDEKFILTLNAAWEILRDKESKHKYDNDLKKKNFSSKEVKARDVRNAKASAAVKEAQGKSAQEENALFFWLKEVYLPIDKLLGQVINPFSKNIQSLSADPYDDQLMEDFCLYLENSQKKLNKIEKIFRSISTPISAKQFGLSLYHCLSQVQDAFNELERYTMGYVDSYLHDGKEMLRKAEQRRLDLKKDSKNFSNL